MGVKNVLKHYGIPRRSGRYPWGSGADPDPASPRGKASEGRGSRDAARARELLSNRDVLDNTSIQELRNLADRMDVQMRLKNLVASDQEASKSFVSKAMGKIGKDLMSKITQEAATSIFKYVAKKYTKDPFSNLANMPTDQLKEAVARLGLEAQYRKFRQS